jgi:CPA2 family monovalent cation:H+ antiporter-2
MGIAADLSIVLVAGLAGGVLARLLKQPLVLGYLVAGILVGPNVAGLTVGDTHNLELLAEIGVALLLFGLGLELSLKDLAAVRGVALAGTPLQIGLTILLGVGLGRWLGLGWIPSVWLGAMASLSSTMVVLKTLQAQGRIGTLSSRVMLGMLVVQDLAFVPLVIVLPKLGDPQGGAVAVVVAALKAAAFLALMLLVGTRAFPWLVERVARTGSRELFLLVTTGLALGLGYATYLAGLSYALGAFVAGVILSESDYSHQALSDIIPLRDVFSLLFFASVGMLLDPAQLLAHWRTVLITVVVLSAGKAVIFWAVTRGFGYRNVVPIASALGLFQIGEFSFVLARAGLSAGAIPETLYAWTLNAAVVTMAVTPFVSGLTGAAYSRFGRRRGPEPVQAVNLPAEEIGGHVVIVGAGRTGSQAAAVLRGLGLPFVLIELDHRRMDTAKAAGFAVIYGDASREPVLDAASISTARLVLVTTPALAVSRAVVEHARQVSPRIRVVVQASDFDATDALRTLDATAVVQPEFEASLEVTRQALLHLDVSPTDILQLTDRIRGERYAALPGSPSDQHELIATLGTASRLLTFRWIRLAHRDSLDGKTIGESHIRTTWGVSIVAIVRGETVTIAPGPETRLFAGEVVAVIGRREQVMAFEQRVGEAS